MSHFRFIVEGSEFEMRSTLDDEDDLVLTGFFTTRRASGRDREAAEQVVLQQLTEEWATHAPQLSILDSWEVPRFEFRRIPNKGHSMFSDEESRYAAASLEAEASRAPEGAKIWRLAALYTPDE